MKDSRRQDMVLLSIQLLFWVGIILIPGLLLYLFNPAGKVYYCFSLSAILILPFVFLFFLSFYFLIPRYLEKGKTAKFILAVIGAILLANVHYIRFQIAGEMGLREEPFEQWHEIARIGVNAFMSVMFSLDLCVIATAILHRRYICANRRALELQEEKQKSIEAELVWLKNQLNPHFLFNSLNNISSLTQIDPNQAQEAIAQLSDLLRYALYESQKPLVPLAGEVEFMQNYIAMMKLRCSDKTEVIESFQIGTGHEQIAPLLFVSFIENAFKHGTSSNLNSRIGVSLQVRDGKIIFECRNTNLPKDQTDHSGSGIGLENTRRRLDLCYPNRYSWEQKVENDEYYIKIEILL